jgi:hypothetical protein
MQWRRGFHSFVEMFRVSSFSSNMRYFIYSKVNRSYNILYVINYHVQVGLHESNFEFHIISHKSSDNLYKIGQSFHLNNDFEVELELGSICINWYQTVLIIGRRDRTGKMNLIEATLNHYFEVELGSTYMFTIRLKHRANAESNKYNYNY